MSNFEAVMGELAAIKELVLNQPKQHVKQFGGYGSGGYGSGGGGVLNKDIVDLNNMLPNSQYFGREGGLFVDCDMQAPVMNLTLQPQMTLANLIPVEPTTEQYVRYGYISQITAPGAGPQNNVCDIPPSVAGIATCSARYDIGRISYGSPTLELDRLIQKAHKGVVDDFYVVGNLRGVSAIPTSEQLRDVDFIKASAVKRQMMLIGRAFQNQFIQWFWTGDPTNPAQNGANGGWRSWYGMLSLVANDYGTKPFVTGTNCAALNSDIKNFENNYVGGNNSIYEFMRELEETIYTRAQLMGLLPATWVWVMRPEMWGEVSRVLPCEMVSEGCSNGVVNVNDGGNGLFNLAMRNSMQTNMTIDTNGRTHRVVLDHGIPYTEGVDVTSSRVWYGSSIFFIPLTVAGETVLKWRHFNYNEFASKLAGIPGGMDKLDGWTDNGRVHWIIDHVRRCFQVDAKMEFGLVFTAPHLAGRIDNVRALKLQAKPQPFPAAG